MVNGNRFIQALFCGLIMMFCAGVTAQTTVQANRVIARDSFKLGARWIYLIETDATFDAATDRSVPSTQAVKDFVLNSSVDTLYLLPGSGVNPDTLCVEAGKCVVLPVWLTASDVAAQISDSLDWVRDTTQDLRVAITALEGDVAVIESDITAIEGTLAGVVDGSGTAGYIPKFSDANTLTNSLIQDDGTRVGIGTAPASPAFLKVNGHLHLSGAVTRYLYFTDNTAVVFGYENGAWIANGGAGSTFGIRQNNATKFYMDANARFGIGAAVFTPGSLVDVQTPALGTTQTNASGLTLSTAGVAASAAQQISNALRWRGYGWGTTAGTSQPVDFRSYVVPVQGTVPTGYLNFGASVNGGAYTENIFTIGTDGTAGIASTAYSGSFSRLHIRGSGNSSSTRGLAVYRSNGTNVFSVGDDGRFTVGDYGTGNATDFQQSGSILLMTAGSSTGTIYFDTGLSRSVSGTKFHFNNSGSSFGTTAHANMVDIEGNLAVGASYSGTTAAPANGLIVEGSAGFGTNNPLVKMDVRSSSTNTTGVFSIANSTVTTPIKFFATNATPESAITASPGDVAFSNAGNAYLKETGSATNTGWKKIATITDLTNYLPLSITGSTFVNLNGNMLGFLGSGAGDNPSLYFTTTGILMSSEIGTAFNLDGPNVEINANGRMNIQPDSVVFAGTLPVNTNATHVLVRDASTKRLEEKTISSFGNGIISALPSGNVTISTDNYLQLGASFPNGVRYSSEGIYALNALEISSLDRMGIYVDDGMTMEIDEELLLAADYVSYQNNSTIAGAVFRMQEGSTNGVNYVSVEAPPALAANTKFAYPTTNGTSGHTLKTDGTGITAWGADANGIISALPAANTDIETDYTLGLEDSGGERLELNSLGLNIVSIADDASLQFTATGIDFISGSGAAFGISSQEAFSLNTTNDNISFSAGSGIFQVTAATINMVGTLNANSNLAVTGTATFRGAAGAAGEVSFLEPLVSGTNTHTLRAAAMAANMVTYLPTSAPTTENGVWERDAAGNTILRATVYGSVSGSTDASGDITVSHDNDDGTFNVNVMVTGTTLYGVAVHSKTGSNFKIRFYNTTTGVAVPTTSVEADYTLTDL